MSDRSRTIIAVPLYRSPGLIEGLFDSLIAMADEIGRLPAQLLLINDSPDCAPLNAALDLHLPRLREALEVKLIVNDCNLGFVRSANRAFELGLERRCDVLLLNSDARPRPGAFAEMIAVSLLDPMIGFVSPRSNNATLCNSPYPEAWRGGPPDEAYRHHRIIEAMLPRYTYVPTAVGFCLYVRWLMIEEFGCFDEIYEDGYDEENDLIRRCNRRGYRAVLANQAYVDHLGGISFEVSAVSTVQRQERNHAILIGRYPEYPLAVRRYYESPEYRAQVLLAGLIPLASGRLRILMDCRTLNCSHKGSFEHLRALLGALIPLTASHFDTFILCERDAYDFHGLAEICGLHFCEQNDIHDRPFAVALRPVQPYLLEDIVTLADYAPITGFLVLDTIAMDCQQLDTHGLDVLWRFMAETASLIGYNSEFSRDQFRHRIDVWPHVTEFVSRCSTDVADYGDRSKNSTRGDTILVVGNDYPHKHVAETVAAIRNAQPNAIVETLGVTADDAPHSEPPGSLSIEAVDALYRNADVVVFPSHYEGFGLPILHALAREKPVVARDIPAIREIAGKTAGAANIHFGRSTSEIADLATNGIRWQAHSDGDRTPENWGDAAQAMLDAVTLALQRFDFTTCRRQQAAIMGHRARLDAERRYHEQAAETAGLQSAADRRFKQRKDSGAIDKPLEGTGSNSRNSSGASVAAERHAVVRTRRAHEDADHSRWASSRRRACEWAARDEAVSEANETP